MLCSSEVSLRLPPVRVEIYPTLEAVIVDAAHKVVTAADWALHEMPAAVSTRPSHITCTSLAVCTLPSWPHNAWYLRVHVLTSVEAARSGVALCPHPCRPLLEPLRLGPVMQALVARSLGALPIMHIGLGYTAAAQRPHM